MACGFAFRFMGIIYPKNVLRLNKKDCGLFDVFDREVARPDMKNDTFTSVNLRSASD